MLTCTNLQEVTKLSRRHQVDEFLIINYERLFGVTISTTISQYTIILYNKNLIETTNPNAFLKVHVEEEGFLHNKKTNRRCLIALKNHSCRTLLLDTLLGQSCGTLLRDTLVAHSCKTLLLDTLAWHIWNTSQYYFVLRSVHAVPHSNTLYCKSCTE